MPNLVLTNSPGIPRQAGFASYNYSSRSAWFGAILLLSGCSSSSSFGPIARDQAPPTTIRVDADWDDVYAATATAAGQTESVILTTNSPAAGELVLSLQTIRDEPVEVSARIAGEPSTPGGSVPIDLTCRYGRLGDAREQREMLDAIAARLADLRGVDYRPAR